MKIGIIKMVEAGHFIVFESRLIRSPLEQMRLFLWKILKSKIIVKAICWS